MNSSPCSSTTTTNDLHRKMLDLLLHHAHDMQHVFDTIPRCTIPSTTDIVVYSYPPSGGCYNNTHAAELLFPQFLSIITLAALLEYIQDPDPPEIRELEQQELRYQLELENDSLFMAMEDTQWELERVQRNYLVMKQRYSYLSNNNAAAAAATATADHYEQQQQQQQQQQDLLVLKNSAGQQQQQEEEQQQHQRYSDLQLEYTSLKSDLEDYQIMNQEQLVNRDEMVQGLLQERTTLQNQHLSTLQTLTKLQTQLETYQAALTSKDLKLFQLVEERDSLKHQVKDYHHYYDQAKNKLELGVFLSNNNNNNNNNNQNNNQHDDTHSKASTTSTSTTSTPTGTSSDDDEESSTEHSPVKTTTIASASPNSNRWVQGLKNRIRPATSRRSPKVQMEH
jgi:hypothetical protein